MSVPMTLASAADLVDLSIQRMKVKATNLTDEKYSQYYHVESTEDYYDKDSGISGFGEASRMTESSVIISESPVQTFDRTYTQVFHGKMAQFTLYDWKYGLKRRKLEKVTRDLLNSCRRKRERLTTSYLENSIGATTSMTVTDLGGNYSKAVTGGDALAAVNSAHTREDGGTAWDNVITDEGGTANMDFDIDGLKAAFYTGSQIVDPKGNEMDIDYDLLVCRKGSSVFFSAMEINGALQRNQVPQSADNDGAPFGVMKILALPYLTTSAAAYWWTFDTSMMDYEMGLQYRGSQGVEIDPAEKDYKTKSILVSSTCAFDNGHNDSRNLAGSDGTNS